MTRKHKRVSVGAQLDSRRVKGGHSPQRDRLCKIRTVQVYLAVGESPSAAGGWDVG